MIKFESFKNLAEGLTNFLWKSSRTELDIDKSVRDCISNRLVTVLIQNFDASIDSETEALEYIMDLISKNSSFRNQIENINQKTIEGFNNHFITYGGKSAFFAFCLSLSLSSKHSEDLTRAKVSLLEWYFGNRRTDYLRLNGGSVSVWFPFEWLTENFNALVASFIAGGLYDIIKSSNWKDVIKNFSAPLLNIKKEFNPYPRTLVEAVGHPMSMKEFAAQVDGHINESYFYLFNLDQNQIEMVATDWCYFFFTTISSLSKKEQNWLNHMLEAPFPIDINKDYHDVKSFRKKDFINLVERAQGDFAISIYPPDIQRRD